MPTEHSDAFDELHDRLVATQDALTHLWAAVLALEQIDAAPVSDPDARAAAMAHLTECAQEARATIVAFRPAFADWALIVEQQQYEASAGADVLKVLLDMS